MLKMENIKNKHIVLLLAMYYYLMFQFRFVNFCSQKFFGNSRRETTFECGNSPLANEISSSHYKDAFKKNRGNN